LHSPAQNLGRTDALAAAKEAESPPFRERSTVFTEIVSRWEPLGFAGFGEARERWLSFLRVLAPLVVHLGGREAIAESFRAIRDMTGWWS
jgi:hypothetical protein